MAVEKARSYYLGQNGYRRVNCAQAVVSAFKEHFNISDDMLETFRSFGGGNAPEGVCGAYYAVRCMLENNNKEMIKDFEKYFLDSAGAVKCTEVKANKKLSCVGCVEKSAEFVAKLI
ncbi:MAG: C-GCAxxG-C-C family protein [Clostridia bacterium]|nr:C-GCAxxG-C-C family protein [Clostridia bacterium]